jgi:hypothetical protein
MTLGGNVRMRLRTKLRAAMARVVHAPTETKIAVAIPLLLALLAVPVMLGAFASESESPTAAGGYGTTTQPPLPPPTTGATGTTVGSEVVGGPGATCGTVTVKLAGFMAGSTVTATLLTGPTALGTATADASGAVIVTFTPAANLSGTQTVEGHGVDPAGSPFTARVLFTACTTPATQAAPPGFTG